MSKFVEGKFVDQLKNLPSYKKCNFGEALVDAFRLIDELISSESGEKELQ